MERSIITDQVHPDLETALREIQKMGYRSVELHNVFGKSIEACTDEEVSQIKLFLDRYGMRVSNIASTICFLCPLYEGDEVSLFNPSFFAIESDLDTHFRMARRAAKIAKQLGAPNIRVFPFRYPDNRKGPYGSEKDFETIIAAMKRIASIGKEEGVVFVLENCPYSHCPKGEMTLRIIKAVNQESLRLLWDPANSFRAEKDLVPDSYKSWSLLEELEALYPYIDHIHVKDYRFRPELAKPFEHRILGEGEIDFLSLFDFLKNKGFSKAVSLEPEVDPEGAIESMIRLDSIL